MTTRNSFTIEEITEALRTGSKLGPLDDGSMVRVEGDIKNFRTIVETPEPLVPSIAITAITNLKR